MEIERVVLMYSNSIWVVPLLLSFAWLTSSSSLSSQSCTHTHTHNNMYKWFPSVSVFSLGCRPGSLLLSVSAACKAAHCQPTVPIKSHETGTGWSWRDRRRERDGAKLVRSPGAVAAEAIEIPFNSNSYRTSCRSAARRQFRPLI
jgi:hypothetical protein